MKNAKKAKEIIEMLSEHHFFCMCPCGCGEEITLRDAGLFYLDDFSAEGKEAHAKILEELRDQKRDLAEQKANLNKKPQVTARAVNMGLILERIAPAFAKFPFAHHDCRSLFDPIDYVIFENLHKTGTVTKIIFTEIKTGNARLNEVQKDIRDVVRAKKVDFKIYSNEK